MSTIHWLGSAPATAGVQTWTFVTAGTIGDIITVTVGAKTLTYTTTSATIATFLPLLATALTALSRTVYPEIAEITWGSTSSTLTGTAKTAGKPFTATVSTNSSGTVINKATITGATNATPIVITSTAHGYTTGTVVTVASVGGTTAANGTWTITRVDANSYSLNTSVGNGVYTSGGTSTAPTGVVTTASSGPYDASTARNYSGNLLPVTGDTLYIYKEGARILYGLDQSLVVLAVRRISAKDVIIGLPETNADGTPYNEYRLTYWQMTATSDYVNTDSGRIKLNHGTGQTTFEVERSGTGAERGMPAVMLTGTHASNVFNVYGGNVGIAFLPNETATVSVLRMNPGTAVTLGIGCTISTIHNYGGSLEVHSAIGTALNHPGTGAATTTINGAGAVAQITLQGGRVNYNTTGTLGGTTVLAGSAFLTVDGESGTKTITNPITIASPSAQFVDTNGVVTGGYTLRFVNCTGSIRAKPNSQFIVSSL